MTLLKLHNPDVTTDQPNLIVLSLWVKDVDVKLQKLDNTMQVSLQLQR